MVVVLSLRTDSEQEPLDFLCLHVRDMNFQFVNFGNFICLNAFYNASEFVVKQWLVFFLNFYIFLHTLFCSCAPHELSFDRDWKSCFCNSTFSLTISSSTIFYQDFRTTIPKLSLSYTSSVSCWLYSGALCFRYIWTMRWISSRERSLISGVSG